MTFNHVAAGSNPAEGIPVSMSEWLRRWPAKPLGLARIGSNPIADALFASNSKPIQIRLLSVGLGPYIDASKFGPLAQLAERTTVNRKVIGSSPIWTAKYPRGPMDKAPDF